MLLYRLKALEPVLMLKTVRTGKLNWETVGVPDVGIEKPQDI